MYFAIVMPHVQDPSELLEKHPTAACVSVLETSWKTLCKENAITSQ